MEKDFLTIKEVSVLANTSYQNIYQRTNTSFKKYVSIIDGHKMLSKDVLHEFNIQNNKVDSVAEDTPPISDKDCRPLHVGDNHILNDDLNEKINDDLNELIKELRAEIKRKDEIIVSKDEQLQKQTEQIIDLSNRVVELFENSQKLQIQTSYLLSENNSERNDLHTLRPSDEIIENRPPKKKGFLSRFFK